MSDLTAAPVYKDRTAGLIVVGILEICLALFFLVSLGFMAIAVFAVSASTTVPQTLNARSMLSAGLFYLALAAFFATMGVGTLRGRRWARTLMLVFSWIWLVMGVYSTVLMIFILPRMLSGMEAAAGTAGGAELPGFMAGCMVVMLAFMYIVVPGILVLFYRSPHVKATVEAKDPKVPWTDRTPAPVLALSLMFGLGAAGSLMGLGYGVLPIFGRILTGFPAMLGLVVAAVLCAVLARAAYLRRPAAWWATLAIWAFGCVSGFFFFGPGGLDMRELYEAMGAATPEMEAMGIYDIWQQPAVLAMMVVGWLGWLGFLIWLRKFFRPAPQDETGAQDTLHRKTISF
jgi:hypothetical protein